MCDFLWPLFLPSQLLPPSVTSLHQSERQVLYSATGSRVAHALCVSGLRPAFPHPTSLWPHSDLCVCHYTFHYCGHVPVALWLRTAEKQSDSLQKLNSDMSSQTKLGEKYHSTIHHHSSICLQSFAEIFTASHIWKTLLHGLWMAAWHGLWMFLYKKWEWDAGNAFVVIMTCAPVLSFELTCLCPTSLCVYCMCVHVSAWLITNTKSRSSAAHKVFVGEYLFSARFQHPWLSGSHHLCESSSPAPPVASWNNHHSLSSGVSSGCTRLHRMIFCTFPFSYFSLNTHICIELLIPTLLFIVNPLAYTENQCKYFSIIESTAAMNLRHIWSSICPVFLFFVVTCVTCCNYVHMWRGTVWPLVWPSFLSLCLSLCVIPFLLCTNSPPYRQK